MCETGGCGLISWLAELQKEQRGSDQLPVRIVSHSERSRHQQEWDEWELDRYNELVAIVKQVVLTIFEEINVEKSA